jgi:hypothetical protein
MEKAGGDYAFTAFTAQENAAFRRGHRAAARFV